jgi:four helix bundle protein
MGTLGFRDLRVYRLSEELADLVWDSTRRWDVFARDTVGKQVVRSADSVGANIAEGSGRGTYQDNRRFVRTARGSLYETRHWLRRAFRRRLLLDVHVAPLQSLLTEPDPTLNAYLNSIGPPTSKR